jgi:dipeptidase E
MKLFLSGGGMDQDSIEIDKKFSEQIDKSKTLLYIPLAINTHKHPYSECLKWIKGIFDPLGINLLSMWTEKELKIAKKADFDNFGGVYIGGGNTFKLLKKLKELGTLDILRDLTRKDIPIYGNSAGAVILTRTIIPALSADINEVGLKNFDALDLLKGYDIFPHYEKSQNNLIKEYIKKYRLKKVIGLPENCGLFVTDNQIKVIGPGSAFVFDKSITEIKPGLYID